MARSFSEIAVEEGFITQDQLEKALQRQKDTHLSLGEILVILGFISVDDRDKINEIRLSE